MLKIAKKFNFIIGVVCLCYPLAGFAEPPPAGVNDVVIKMGMFETSLQAENWEETATSLQTMETTIKEIFMQAQRDDFILEEALVEVQKNIATKDRGKVEEAFEAFQKQYFNFVSHFDHEIHPILVKIEEHVTKRAPAASAAKDYAGMLREMQEAAMLIDHGKAVLIKKGVPEQEIFAYDAKVIALGLALKGNEYAKVGEILTNLQETYAGFMQKYKN